MLNSSIWLIEMTLSGATNQCLRGFTIDDNERVLCTIKDWYILSELSLSKHSIVEFRDIPYLPDLTSYDYFQMSTWKIISRRKF